MGTTKCTHTAGCCDRLVCPRELSRAEEMKREIARLASWDDCIVIGCVHEYGHDGQHEYEDTRASEGR